MGGWSSKKHGFEAGGDGERSFNRRRGVSKDLTFTLWRAGLIESLKRGNVPYQVLDDETIIADIQGEKQIMGPELQIANYKRDLEKYYKRIQEV